MDNLKINNTADQFLNQKQVTKISNDEMEREEGDLVTGECSILSERVFKYKVLYCDVGLVPFVKPRMVFLLSGDNTSKFSDKVRLGVLILLMLIGIVLDDILYLILFLSIIFNLIFKPSL